MHARAQVRAALAAVLGGLATPAAVYMERRNRLDPGLLPAVVVALTDCEAQPGDRTMDAGDGFVVEWAQTVVVEIHATGRDGDVVAPVLDQVELEVETALGADPSLGGLLELLEPTSSALDMTTDQDRTLGVRSITYTATWRAPFGAPDQPEG